jgi:hypothetical protein
MIVDDTIKRRLEATHAARRFLLAQRRYSAALRRRAGVDQAGEALRLAYWGYDAALKSLLNHLTSAAPGAGGKAEIELLRVESATLRASLWAKIVRFGPGSHEAG